MEEIEVRRLLSDNLKRLRKQRNLSQLKLANELGMAMTFINDIENCKKWVSPETLARFVSFFGVPVSEFFVVRESTANVNPVGFVQVLTCEIQKTIEDVKSRFNV